MNITKEEAEKKIEELKKHIADLEISEVKIVGIQIKSIFGNLIFQSTKTTLVEAIREANLYGADLREADLRGANLRGAELCNAKFYGRGGHKKLKRSQLPDFLTALGFDIED
jgi:uncharacterized protein YjbI with pentapeptide repeats